MSNKVAKESVPGISKDSGPAHGWTSVGTTIAQLMDKTFSVTYKGVLIVSDPDNTVTIFIGRNGVTSDKDAETGGIPLSPDRSIFIPIEDPTLLYVISGSASQLVAWMSM